MQYFSHLTEEVRHNILYRNPEPFTKNSKRDYLQFALGAALYIPATLPNIKDRVICKRIDGLTTAVICLEDAISDHEVEIAETKIIQELKEMHKQIDLGQLSLESLPLLFIRVRSKEQLESLLERLGQATGVLTGIALPKFTTTNGKSYLDIIDKHCRQYTPLYALPILESREIIYKETRGTELLALQNLLKRYREIVLNVRIGATDLSGLFGLRRSREITVYDVAIMRDVIADIVNTFGREENYFTISAPVWEYFSKQEDYIDYGLIREVLLDNENGLIGKTIIHPSHLQIVQALQVVTYEEYMDALSIMQGTEMKMGVLKSVHSNKMNECKPHRFWAEKVLMKSRVYGVFYEERTYTDLLSATKQIPNIEKPISKS